MVDASVGCKQQMALMQTPQEIIQLYGFSLDYLFAYSEHKIENNTKWRDQNWIEKLGENWTYRVGGQKKEVFFLEKEMFSNWQDNESKWEDYANQLIDEALTVRDFLEKNS